MTRSIRQQIVNAVADALKAAAPVGVTVVKGRKEPASEDQLPLVQIYWHIEDNKAVGDPRRPVLTQRNMVLEIKASVAGDDEELDQQCQWIVAAMWALCCSRVNGLAKSVIEAQTQPFPEESSAKSDISDCAIRYQLEYTTLPGDLTKGN